MPMVRAGGVTGRAEVALTLSVPASVRSGGRSVIAFVTSGSVEAGDLLTAACPTFSAGVDRSMPGAGSVRSWVNEQTGHGSVNGATMRMTNRAAKNFVTIKDGYSTVFN
jgi:hypothetical protein